MRTLTASTGVVLEYDWWAFSAIGADIADADLLGMPAGPLVREGVSCTLGGEPALYVRRRIKGERARFRAAESGVEWMRARACARAEAGKVPHALTLPSGTGQGSLQATEAASGRLRADAQASTDLRPARPGSPVRQHRTAHQLPGQPGHLRHGGNMAALRSSPRARVARLLGCGLHLRQEIRFREHQRLPRLRRRLPMRLMAIPPTRACRLRQWSSAPATPIVTHILIIAHIGEIFSTAVMTCCTRPPERWRPYSADIHTDHVGIKMPKLLHSDAA
ncbi:hypothetical protein AB0C40_13720 [Streptomyces brevispora]|uniref:hypothetical protein n=1 Tax=Streptomyces brevispora TaxID=887462 RepID=UPI0033C44E50